ncbi:hypothetical protein hmeg3_05835 [Herbaspirillum sp. meg3]|nr:hypothetical protein hmeg3_05835 [Herbaspirillum sp. meg3]
MFHQKINEHPGQGRLLGAPGVGLGGNESCLDLLQPYGGSRDGVKVQNGYITMPDLPGIGFEGKANLYQQMQKPSV